MMTTRLADGRFAAVAALEVLRVPDASVISDLVDAEPPTERLRDEFTQLITEFASLREVLGQLGDVFAEIAWRAVPTTAQSHAAEIRTFVVVRALTSSADVGSDAVCDALQLFQGTLGALGYDVTVVEPSALAGIYGESEPESVVAVHRRARTFILQHPAIPSIFDYDRLPERTVMMERLFSALVDAPGSFIVVQLGATRFDRGEVAMLSSTATALGVLERGSTDPMLGGVSFATARRPAETYMHYYDRATGPVFLLNVIVGGPLSHTRALTSRIVGAFAAAAEEGTTELVPVVITAQAVGFSVDVAALPWRVSAAIDEAASSAVLPVDAPAGAARLPRLVTGREASQLFRLPYGSDRVGAGFRVNFTARRSRSYLAGVLDHDIEVGFIGRPDAGMSIGFTLGDLTKHMFVAGTPGSGKTTFNVSLLHRLWSEHGIPFLVIEPAKNEYRAMLEAIPDLRVFTPGKSWLSPLVLNPFRPAAGVRIENHKTVLKTAFGAALTMTSPLDRLFESALDDLYAGLGWLDSDSTADGHTVPNVRDFVKAFTTTFDRVGYTGDALNIGRAGLVRLAALVRAFDTYQSIPVEALCSHPTIIELSAIESSAEKTLYIALLLLLMLSYHNANTLGGGTLRQALLLEEAHVLFEASDPGQEGSASPAAIAQGLLKRMLAEIRSYGVGIVVADQSPRKVGADVIALTNIKLGFRIVEAEDRKIFGNSTNMDDEQIRRLAGLRPGEAFLFHDRLTEPEEIVTPDYRAAAGIPTSITDGELAQRLTFYAEMPELLRPFPESALVPEWDPARADVARQFAARIFARHVVEAGVADADGLRAVYGKLRESAAALDRRYPVVDDTLLNMLRVYFLRLVRYESGIDLPSDYLTRVLMATVASKRSNT
jgi:hypothetical protein